MPFRPDKPSLFHLAGYKVYDEEVKRFHESTARSRIVSAPARTSKSYATAYDHLPDCMPFWTDTAPRKPLRSVLGWIVGSTFTMVKEWDYLLTELRDRKGKLGLGYDIESCLNNPSQGHMRLILRWGLNPAGDVVRTVIEVKSAANEQTMQGEEVDWAIVSEAAEIDERIIRRYLSTRCKKLTYPTTPKLKAAYLLEMIQNGKDEAALGIESFQFTPMCNPRYDYERYWEEHAKAEFRSTGRIDSYPPDDDVEAFTRLHCFDPGSDCTAMKDPWFGEQFGGLWTGESERLLPFSEQIHVLSDIPTWFDYAQRYLAVDYGYNDAAVALWFAVGPDGAITAYREIYEQKMNPERFVDEILERTEAARERLAYCVGDPSRPEVADLMRRRGLTITTRSKNAMRDRAAGLLQVVDHLSVDPATGEPKLRFASEDWGDDYGCPRSIHELKSLRKKSVRDEFSAGGIVGADHAFDACRYFLQSRPSRGFLSVTGQELEQHKRWIRSVRKRNANALEPYPLVGNAPASYAGVA